MANREMKDSGVEWIGEIPIGWQVLKFKYVMKKDKVIAKKYNNEDVISLTKSGVIIRDLENPTGKMPASFDGYQHVKEGDLLLCLFDIDVTPRCVGIVRDNGVTSPAYSRYKLLDGYDINYYNYLLTYIDNEKILLSYTKSLRNTLTNEYFGAISTIKPSLEEQQKIAAFLDEKVAHIDSIIEDTKQSIENLKSYKQNLITETLTRGLNANVEMKDSGIEWMGKIPKNWNISKLGYLGYLQNGISKSGEAFGSGYPFVSYGDVYSNSELPTEASGLIESTPKERDNYSVQYGDVFFARTSETIEEVGFASTCLKSIEDAVFAGFLIKFRAKDKKLNPLFSKYYFRSNLHRKYFEKEMNIVTRASLSQGLLKKLPVLLPPIDEQHKIAEFLDEKTMHIDSILKDKKRLIYDFQSYKKSLVYECVTGKKEVK